MILVKLASLVLLPVYTRSLDPAEFGTLELLYRNIDILTLCLFLNGNRLACLTFYGQARGDDRKRAVVGTAICFGLLNVAFTGGLAILLAGPISGLLGIGGAGLLRVAFLYSLVDALTIIPLALAQARLESLFYAMVLAVQALVRVGLIVGFVWFLRWGVWGVMLASLITSVLFAVVLTAREVARDGFHLDCGMLREMAWFALPFLPAGFCGLLLNNGDQFFLVRFAGKWEVGIYALGCKLGMLASAFTTQPLYQVWSAKMYEAAERPDAAAVFGRVFSAICGVYLLAGLSLCLFSREVVEFLGEERYLPAASIVPPVVLAYFFLSAANLMDSAFYIRRRTPVKTYITLGSTVVMVALYMILIPRAGARGAAHATLIGFVLHAAVTLVVSRRFLPVDYNWPGLALMVGSAALAWSVSTELPLARWSIAVKIALLSAWVAILWCCDVVHDEDKQRIRGALTSFLRAPSRLGKSLSFGRLR